MTTATEILKASLESLATALGRFSASHSSDLQPLRVALDGIYKHGMEATMFRKNIVELAKAVIEVRKRSASLSPLQKLPVPPYDLWLPFMAQSSASPDIDLLAGVSQIFNTKVRDLDSRLANGASEDLNRPVSPLRDKIFICYAQEDENYLKDLTLQMAPFLQKHTALALGELSVWDGRKIKPGQDWLNSINTAIACARVAILLVSRDFLASEFIMENELPQILAGAETGEITLLWISVRPNPHERVPFAKYQCLNNPEKPLSQFDRSQQEQELLKICRRIFEVVESLTDSASAVPHGLASQAGWR